MSRYYSYLNSAHTILQQYHGKDPFILFLKKYFKKNKKYGSKDRKQISHLCYCYYRLGKMFIGSSLINMDQQILSGLFLCSTVRNEMLQHLKPAWNESVNLNLQQKLSLLNLEFSSVFPWQEDLSDGIDYVAFSRSFFIQPDLFLRIRPGNEVAVKQKLEKAGMSFNHLKSNVVALPNASKVDGVLEINKEVVIQDYSSQQTGWFLKNLEISTFNNQLVIWDCCAASGGKSIMAHDIFHGAMFTVSDIRKTILINLKKRFEEASIKNFRSLIIDLANPQSKITGSPFDLVICDAPCTGSGTWSRNPEQLYYFDKKKIDHYSSLQKKIVTNAVPHLKPGGYFLYITCSVFKKENEEVVDYIVQNSALKKIKMEVLKGYDKKADTMFVALFVKKDSVE